MKNMAKGLVVPKWVLIVQPKIPQMLQNLSAQGLDLNEKRHMYWVSKVRVSTHCCFSTQQ